MVLINLDEAISIIGEDTEAANLLREKYNSKIEHVPQLQRNIIVGKPSETMCSTHSHMVGGNSIPRNEYGSTFHLGVKSGDIHPRILTVGSPQRARIIAQFLSNIKEIESNRQMVTISGLYKNVPVSICACHMGAPNFDMFFREASNTINKPMVVIRLGTCGINNVNVEPGTLFIASKGSIYAFKNYLYFDGSSIKSQNQLCNDPYLFSSPVPSSKELNEILLKNADKSLNKIINLGEINQTLYDNVYPKVYEGLNACGESFYSTQGRIDPLSNDINENVIPTFDALDVDFIDMETHQLLHLAKLRNVKCHATSCCIGIVNRKNPSNSIDRDLLQILEKEVGKVVLDTLIEFELEK